MKTTLTLLVLLLSYSFLLAQENGGPYNSDENTVLLMHFDGDISNSAAVGNDANSHGSGISFETGIHGQCLRLDNTNADNKCWIEVPFYDDLNFTDEFSIECWFKINSWENVHNRRAVIVRKGTDWPAEYDVQLNYWSEGINARVNCINDSYDRNVDLGTYTNTLTPGQWYHISITCERQTTPEEYWYMDFLIRDENFNEVYTTNAFNHTGLFNDSGNLYIGFGNYDKSYFDGWIDELRISKKKREYRDDIVASIDTENLKDSVAPLLRDNWTVYYPPICNYFPIDTLTGERFKGNSCGMTIMIRLLHFWEFPRFPSGELDYWFGPVHWEANFDTTEYLYDLMPNSFGPDPDEEEYGPSSIFSQQVSAATRTHYDFMGSMPDLLVDHFHFKDTMKMYYRHNFSREEWINILKNELDQGRPVLTAGLEEVFESGGAAGHYYIIDGYNAEDKFHTDLSFGSVDYWVDIDAFPYGKFQSIIVFAEPDFGNKSLQLKYPTGGEYLNKQSEIEIKWEAKNINNVKIEYTSDGGKTYLPVNTNIEASKGSLTWKLPETVSNDYKIRIADTDDGNIYRKTKKFNVFDQQFVSFEYPRNNTNFKRGTTQPVYWESDGLKMFYLEYSKDGVNWNMLSDSVDASSGYTFVQYPDVVTNNSVLKATAIDDNNLSFSSDQFNLISNQLWGGPYEQDENTLLLMHFEKIIRNEANNQYSPYEIIPIDNSYFDNYHKNLGKSFRVYNIDSNTANAIHVSNSEDIDLGNNWTMEAWVKVASIMGERTVASLVINKWDAFNIGAGWQHFAGVVFFENGSNVEFYHPEEYKLNEWYHVAMVSNAADKKIYFYVHDKNYVEVFKDVKSFPAGSNGQIAKSDYLLTVGGLGGGSNMELDGYIDEVRIVKSAVDYNSMVVGIENQIASERMKLNCYPNPVSNQSVLTFQTNSSGHVNISIFDSTGRKIRTLHNNNMSSGKHEVFIGNTFSSTGLYYCKLISEDGVAIINLLVR